MDTHTIEEHEGDRPQWLGSLARRAKVSATNDAAPAFDETTGAQWLGSVARRQSELGSEVAPTPSVEPAAAPQTSGGWSGSSVRSAVFSRPQRAVEAAAPPVQVLPGNGRVVSGALGMTLRAA